MALYTPQHLNASPKCDRHYNSYAKSSHVGIVVDVADKPNKDGSWNFTTVERKSHKVGICSLKTSDRRGKLGTCAHYHDVKNNDYAYTIHAFFTPNWADGKTAPAHLSGLDANAYAKKGNGTSGTSTGTTTGGTSENKPVKSSATVTLPTSATYKAKFSVTENNATVVGKITKTAGSKVNYVGLVMYTEDWKLVCDKTFSVTNVSNASTSFHAWFDVKKEMGVTLKPGTKYIYRIYTGVDGKKYVSDYYTFTTKAATSSTNGGNNGSTSNNSGTASQLAVRVTYPTDPAYLSKFSISSDNAVVVAKITKPKGSRVNYVGLVMYTEDGKLVCDKTFSVTNVSNASTSFHAWFDVKKEMGVTLQPGTGYIYRIYTGVDGKKYVSDYYSFTTKAATSSTNGGNNGSTSNNSGTASQPAVRVTYPTDPAYLKKVSVSSDNAVVVAKITKPAGSKVNTVGVVLFTADWEEICDKTFSVTNVSNSSTSFHAWFDVKKELGVTLKPGTKYIYRISARVDGQKYVGNYYTFTTK